MEMGIIYHYCHSCKWYTQIKHHASIGVTTIIQLVHAMPSNSMHAAT